MLSGEVQDAAGKPVAGARISIAIAGSQAVYLSSETTLAGAFSFTGLRPGVYTVTVNAPNFEPKTVRNIRVGWAGAGVSLAPIRLLTGAPPAAAHEIVAQTSREEIDRLPLPGRNPFYALDLLPGYQRNGRSRLWSLYGESAAVAALTYDGVDVRSDLPALGASGLAVTAIPAGPVAEAFVATGAISGCGCPLAGFTPPSGSNSLHGLAYWLMQPPGASAQHWADNARGAPSRRLTHRTGASLGGPLRRNRLFFFADFEALLDHSAVTRAGEAPNRPLTSRDPVLQRVLALIPSDPSGRYSGWQDDGGSLRSGLARLDYAASDRHTLGLTFSESASSTDDPSDSSVFGGKPTTTMGLSSRVYSASWRWSPSAGLTNHMRAGGAVTGFEVRNALRSQFPFIAVLGPEASTSQPMAGLDPQRRDASGYTAQDDLNWRTSRHSVQAGFWLRESRLQSEGAGGGVLDSGTVPRYVVDEISGGLVSFVSQRFNLASAGSTYSSGTPVRSLLSTTALAGYLHDTWKPAPPLAVSLGLRFDWLGPARVRRGAVIIPVLSATPSESAYDKELPFTFASEQDFYRNDLDNYALYVGLAWKPARTLPIVVRGSANLSTLNDNLLPNMSFLALQNPFQNLNVAVDLGANRAPVAAMPAAPAPPLPAEWSLASLSAMANSYHQQPGAVYGVNPNLATPNIKYWNVGIEGGWKRLTLDIRYLGNRLEEGARSVDRNQVMLRNGFLEAFRRVRADLQAGGQSAGFPGLAGGGLCSNFNLQNCRPDLYARSLILTGQAGELARWYEGQGYDPGVYNLLGNPLAPGGINILSHLGASRFDALQFTIARRVGSGVHLQTSYLLSKVLSSLNDYRPGAVDPFLDLNNPSLEWAPSPYNLTHAFKAAVIQEFSPLRDAGSQGLLGKILNRWRIAATVVAQSGAPLSLLSGGYVTMPDGSTALVSGLGTLTSQADSGQNTVATSLPGPEIRRSLGIRKSAGGVVTYVNAPSGSFQEPAPGTVGNLQRRMFSGPGAVDLNLGLHKSIPLGERVQAEFRAEAINLLNRVDWLVRDQVFLGTAAPNGAPAFNNDIVQWNSPRSLQFTLQLAF